MVDTIENAEEARVDESERTAQRSDRSGLDAFGDELAFLRNGSDNTDFHLASRAYYEERNYEEAIERYQAVIEYEKSQPSSSPTKANRTTTEKLESYHQEQEANDVTAKAMYWLGESYIKVGRINQALETFEQLANDCAGHYLAPAAQRRASKLSSSREESEAKDE